MPQNAMAITRVLGKPSLFITFTANPHWPEIQRHLLHGQRPDSRPDLIAKVFKLKLDALLIDLKEKHIFGKCIGCVYTIEYQKRGMPHAHILLFLHQNDIPRCAEHVDQLVHARLPTFNPSLAALIKKQNTHGPCGPRFPNSPCMRNGKCSKGFPKRWCEETVMMEGSYPEYARPRDGQTWGEGFTFDNRWVVPFNPYLSTKYCAHINVEVAKGVRAIKYLAKYVYKGSDLATLSMSDRCDEISMTVQGRYISPSQSIWRLLEYTTHQEKPAVMLLPYHLEGRHRVVFDANMNEMQVSAAVASQSSPFLDWMDYNRNHTDGLDLLYDDFPYFYTHVGGQGWHPRIKGQTIGRMPIAHPSQLEHFYLRLLLTVKRGAKSYRDLYTVNGREYQLPSEACRAWGLLADDSEWISFFNQIKDTATGASLRQTMAVIIANASLTDAKSLWERYIDNFTDDCLHRISQQQASLNPPPVGWTDDQCRTDYGLWLLGGNLMDFGRDWAATNLDPPIHSWVSINPQLNTLIEDALRYQVREGGVDTQYDLCHLSPGQRQAYNTIISTIDNGRRPNTFYLQGPAGTGKTFLYKTLCHYYRSQGKIVLCVASSGIAALLLPGGRTAHSQFSIPINSNRDTQCQITGNSELAGLLRATHMIIWDEVTLQNKYDFGAVDKVLRFLKGNSDLFGGIPVVLGGDFAQILPVVKGGRRPQFVSACIKFWSEWHLIQPLFLTQNMRVLQGEMNRRFADWLSHLSYHPNLYGVIDFPPYIKTTDNRGSFRDFVYPPDQLRSGASGIFRDRAILSSRNDLVESFNTEVAGLRIAEIREYVARDVIEGASGDDLSDYPPEILLSLSGSGLPHGKLKLQVGMPVMLLRNLYPKLGLCNGTRLIITQLFPNGIQGEIVSPDARFNGELHFIHRIPVTTNDDLPFTLIRNQLPLRPCFSMTINKSQGQTLQRVGVDLSVPVFTHGQLYVALSRVTNVSNLIVLLPSGCKQTNNIVYPEVLLREE